MLFGDSYITRLSLHCKNNLGVPGHVLFLGKGGLRTDHMDNRMLNRAQRCKARVAFVHIGGNDISPYSSPYDIFRRIEAIVECFVQQGMHDVYVGNILARGDFSKCPGLTKECFEKQRKKVNKLLEQRFKEKFVKFKDIFWPHHYCSDMVHLSTDVSKQRNSGMARYYNRIRCILCKY